jgi:hypothetical protein
MSETIHRHGFGIRLSIAIVLLVACMAIAPAGALAQVQPFATAPPSGSGGGVGEVWPWGFGVVTSQSGALWGDDSGDTYSMFDPSDAAEVTGTTRKYVAWVDKNPADYQGYIKLRDLTTSTDSTPTFVTKSRNYPTITGPSFIDSDDATYTAGSNAWFIVLDPGTLTSGHTYQWRFLRGIKANNNMTCVTYTPAGSSELGYIQLNNYYTDYTDPDQLGVYAANKFNTYEFRSPYTGVYEDFTFEFDVD